MFSGRTVLVVIPARGGSKGIPLKNIRRLGGIPLVGWVGRVVAKLPQLDRAVVSTDHDGIAAVAEGFGIAAPFRRPETLSGPAIGDWDVLNHALLTMEAMDATRYDVVVMLQPTSPNRRAEDVTAALEQLIAGDLDAVWSVSETDSKGHPLKQLVVGPGQSLDYYDPHAEKIVARQQLSPVYHRNGIVYAATRDCILDQKTIKGRRCGALVIDRPVANIDTEIDIAWAEFLLSRG